MHTLMVSMLCNFFLTSWILPAALGSFSDWQQVDASSHVSHRPLCSLPEFWICDWVHMWMRNETAPDNAILPEIFS